MPRRLLFSAAILSFSMVSLYSPVASADPAGFCNDGAIVIVDGVQECREVDTLEKLIADIEAADVAASPYSAGNEGDREALRRLPDVSLAADQAFSEKMQTLQMFAFSR